MADVAQLLWDQAAKQAGEFNSSPFSQFVNDAGTEAGGKLSMAAQDIANALMAPGRALQGGYDLMVDPATGVNYYDGMTEDAANLAGLVSLGAAPIPRPVNSLGMGGRASGGFDQYLDKVNPGRIRIGSNDRPNLGMGDMYGMLPKKSVQVGTIDAGDLGPVNLMKGSDGAYYATGWNPDVMENDVFGYAMPRGDMVELAVVSEAQNKGIGSELQYLLRRDNPYLPTGGLTEQGEAALRRTYLRLLQEGRI